MIEDIIAARVSAALEHARGLPDTQGNTLFSRPAAHPEIEAALWEAARAHDGILDDGVVRLPNSIAVELLARCADSTVAKSAAHLRDLVARFVRADLRAAVLARPKLAQRWPLTGDVAGLVHLSEGWLMWPGEAAPLPVMTWARDALNAAAAGAGDRAVERARGKAPVGVAIESTAGVDDVHVALLYLAEKEVAEAARTPAIRISARREAQAVVAMLGAGAPTARNARRWTDVERNPSAHRFELAWAGRRHAYQLHLGVDDQPIERAVLQGIMRELQEDGVRDWFVYHRMAGEQGHTGTFRWSWAEHRERTDYARRVRTKNASDAELARAASNRLHRFQSAHLHAAIESVANGVVQIGFVLIGDDPLLVVTKGIDELRTGERTTTVAEVRLNKVLYDGARAGRDLHFALIPEAALTLPAMELRLLAMLVFSWRNNYDAGAVARLQASTLWQYADIRKGAPQRSQWPAARATLERVLSHLGRAAGLDWTNEGTGPTAVYTITPPAWWRDRVLHGVRPELPANTAALPRTGAELAAWRAERGLSLRDVQAATGIGKTTVARAEQERSGEPLPAGWLPLLSRIGSNRGSSVPDR